MIMEQIKDVEESLIKFECFLGAALTPGTVHETLKALCKEVEASENDADCSLRRMIDSLSTYSFLPSTREDLIAIAVSCDKIANKGETIARQMTAQKFVFPAGFEEDIKEILAITRGQFALLEESISRLFSKMSELIQNHEILDRIRAEESKVDVIEYKLNERIFDMDFELAKQVQIAHFVEYICDLSDIIENIADRIQIMLITRKS